MIAIYHSADYDGIFCREIAKKFIPEATIMGWNFGDKPIEIPYGEAVVIMDLPPECAFCLEGSSVTWIDHHKTSIDKHRGRFENAYLIDGVAACRLAWQWFTGELGKPLPGKKAFIDRQVAEPLAIRLAGEYDIWDKRDLNAERLQYGLRAQLEGFDLQCLLQTQLRACDGTLLAILDDGMTAQTYAQNVDRGICEHLTWIMEWEGLKFLSVNHARFNSLLFAAKDKPETGHDALLGFRFDGKKWMVSLYHANHNKDIDLSEIAKKHGGGGHRGACGFVCQTLPFTI